MTTYDNYTIKFESRNGKTEMHMQDTKTLEEAKKQLKRYSTLKKYSFARECCKMIVIYGWNDNDSEMTELIRKELA
jgi:hypothetical protein